MLSSFFWGYVVTQVPAGQLAQRIGAKRILLWSMLLCAALTMLTPLSIEYGGWQVNVLRVLWQFSNVISKKNVLFAHVVHLIYVILVT